MHYWTVVAGYGLGHICDDDDNDHDNHDDDDNADDDDKSSDGCGICAYV